MMDNQRLALAIEAQKLALEHALALYAGDERAAEIVASIDDHVGLTRLPEPPSGYTARQLLTGWRIPT